jgi:hypothetical protein
MLLARSHAMAPATDSTSTLEIDPRALEAAMSSARPVA